MLTIHLHSISYNIDYTSRFGLKKDWISWYILENYRYFPDYFQTEVRPYIQIYPSNILYDMISIWCIVLLLALGLIVEQSTDAKQSVGSSFDPLPPAATPSPPLPTPSPSPLGSPSLFGGSLAWKNGIGCTCNMLYVANDVFCQIFVFLISPCNAIVFCFVFDQIGPLGLFDQIGSSKIKTFTYPLGQEALSCDLSGKGISKPSSLFGGLPTAVDRKRTRESSDGSKVGSIGWTWENYFLGFFSPIQ